MRGLIWKLWLPRRAGLYGEGQLGQRVFLLFFRVELDELYAGVQVEPGGRGGGSEFRLCLLCFPVVVGMVCAVPVGDAKGVGDVHGVYLLA